MRSPGNGESGCLARRRVKQPFRVKLLPPGELRPKGLFHSTYDKVVGNFQGKWGVVAK
jgi:hypothetical protein